MVVNQAADGFSRPPLPCFVNHVNASDHPYRKWLGIDSPRPNWFELLGIPDTESDPVRIKVAAKAALSMLREEPEDSGERAAQRQLKRQIKEAYHGLVDPQARAIYLAGLQSAGQPGVPEQETASPLPMAEVVSGEVESPPLAAAKPEEPPATRLRIEVDPVVRRSHRSPRLGLLMLVGLAGTVAALVWVIWANFPTGGNEASSGPESGGRGVTEPDEGLDSDPGKGAAPRQPAGQPPAWPNPDLDPKSPDAPPKDPTDRSGVADPSDQDPGSEPPPDHGVPPEMDSSRNQDPPESGDLQPEAVDTGWAKVVAADESDARAVAHHMQQALVNLRRRDFAEVADRLDSMRGLKLSQQQVEGWQRLATVNHEFRQFQDQVGEIARTLKSLDELQIGDNRVVVTTAGPDEFVFRFGQRIALPYDQLPGLLALAIYEQQHEAASAEYRMAECLLYVMAARRREQYREQASGLLDTAEAAGLPVAVYRDYMDDVFAFPPTGEINRDKMVARTRQLNSQYPAARRDPNQSAEFAMQLRDLALLSRDGSECLALTQRAIDHAEQAGRPWLLTELLVLQRQLVGQQRESVRSMLSSYSAMSRTRLDARQADRLVTSYLELARWCRDRGDQASDQKCLNRARDVCNQFQLQGRLEQIERKFSADPERKTGQFGFD